MAIIDLGRRALFPSKTLLLRGLAAFGFLLITCGISDAKTIYVNAARPTEGGNGNSWGTAHKYLQEALKSAVSGDQVLLAKGTYFPDDFYADENGQYLNFGDRELSFRIKPGVTLFGGFAGNETNVDQRDPELNPTILSGEIWQVTSDPATAGYQRYWSLHVVILEGPAAFHGLIIEKGRANGDAPPFNQGGGIYLETGTVTLTDCVIRECLAAQDGGAIFGNVNATDCVFDNNRADNEFLLTDAKLNDPANTQHSWLYSPDCRGGAIVGDVVAANCRFLRNTCRSNSLSSISGSTARGGVISGTSVVARDCLFDGNAALSNVRGGPTNTNAGVSAGGVISATTTTATNCVFTNNQAVSTAQSSGSATARGGAISAVATTAANCVFVNNGSSAAGIPSNSPATGGAVAGRITTANSSFANNTVNGPTNNIVDDEIAGTTGAHGAALYVSDNSQIIGCTFTGNAVTGANAGGGAVRADPTSALQIANCTFLNNTSTGTGTCLSVGGNVRIISNIFWDTAAAPSVLIRVDRATNPNARARISNRLYPTPSTETSNIVKGSLAGVDISDSNSDLGDPPGRLLINLDPQFVNGLSPAGTDGEWKTADDGIRLTATSPAIGLGHRLFLPPDILDADADGNTTETLPVDNSNFARLQDGTMELGAYEFGTTQLGPEIQIEEPAGPAITDGVGTVTLSALAGVPITRTFTIRNLGTLPLRNLKVTRTGADSGSFALGDPLAKTLNSLQSTTFTLTFTPVAGRDLITTIHVESNDEDENPFDIAVIGRARIPEIAVEHPAGNGLVDGVSTVNYGNVDRVAGLSKSFLIRNSGDGDLLITRISTAGANAKDFVVTGVPAKVAPGASASFLVTLEPSALGARSATLNIVSNDPDAEATFTVNLVGTGVSAPEISIFQPPGTSLADGVTMAYGSVKTGLAFSKTFTIKNIGSATLNNIAVSISGSSEFKLVKPTATKLKTGQTTKFTVTFKPTSLGTKTANVVVTSNDADEGSFDIAVTGTGKSSGSSNKSRKVDSSGRFASTAGHVTIDGLRYRTLTVEKGPGWNKAGLKVQVSSNLVDWFSGRKHTTVLVDDDSILKVRDNTPLEPGTKRYIRLK